MLMDQLVLELAKAGWEKEHDQDVWYWHSVRTTHRFEVDVDCHSAEVVTYRYDEDGHPHDESIHITHPRWRPILRWVLDQEVYQLNHGRTAHENHDYYTINPGMTATPAQRGSEEVRGE